MRRMVAVGTLMADVSDGAVLLNEATGTFYYINATGAFVYRRLRDARRPVADTAGELADLYGMEETETLPAVEAFVDNLVRNGLVQP